MANEVERSLVRAAAFRAMRGAPWWVAVAILAVGFLAEHAHAQTVNCDTFGSRTTCRGPNGYRSDEDTFGSMTRGRDSLGNTWTTDRWGDRTTTRFQERPR
jgi:hypothetical protein